jgi:hypothetical protein
MSDVGCWMFDVQCSMFNVRCSMFDVQCSMLDVGRKVPWGPRFFTKMPARAMAELKVSLPPRSLARRLVSAKQCEDGSVTKTARSRLPAVARRRRVLDMASGNACSGDSGVECSPCIAPVHHSFGEGGFDVWGSTQLSTLNLQLPISNGLFTPRPGFCMTCVTISAWEAEIGICRRQRPARAEPPGGRRVNICVVASTIQRTTDA